MNVPVRPIPALWAEGQRANDNGVHGGFRLKTKLLILTEPMSALGSISKVVYLYLRLDELRAQGFGLSPTYAWSPTSPLQCG